MKKIVSYFLSDHRLAKRREPSLSLLSPTQHISNVKTLKRKPTLPHCTCPEDMALFINQHLQPTNCFLNMKYNVYLHAIWFLPYLLSARLRRFTYLDMVRVLNLANNKCFFLKWGKYHPSFCIQGMHTAFFIRVFTTRYKTNYKYRTEATELTTSR
jgi:hypothetical protein